MIREEAGIGFCNITKCCEEVCPEHIHITDNAIIPLRACRRPVLGPDPGADTETSGQK